MQTILLAFIAGFLAINFFTKFVDFDQDTNLIKEYLIFFVLITIISGAIFLGIAYWLNTFLKI